MFASEAAGSAFFVYVIPCKFSYGLLIKLYRLQAYLNLLQIFIAFTLSPTQKDY